MRLNSLQQVLVSDSTSGSTGYEGNYNTMWLNASSATPLYSIDCQHDKMATAGKPCGDRCFSMPVLDRQTCAVFHDAWDTLPLHHCLWFETSLVLSYHTTKWRDIHPQCQWDEMGDSWDPRKGAGLGLQWRDLLSLAGLGKWDAEWLLEYPWACQLRQICWSTYMNEATADIVQMID